MNNDCLAIIAEFADPKQAMQMKPEFTKKFFPKSILLFGAQEIRQFYRWAQMFDTSNLEEVRIVACDEKGEIGWVPPSVKKLTINCDLNPIRVPDTVAEVVFEEAKGYNITLTDNIRRLRFLDGFVGAIMKWPANLEELHIEGWCRGNGRIPVPIMGLPDSIKHMTLGSHLDITIEQWPESLETLLYEGRPEDHGWSLQDEWFPDGVQVAVHGDDYDWEELYNELPDTVWDL